MSNIRELKKLLPSLEEIAGSGLIKKSSKEYASPCPKCGGNDRFFWLPGEQSGHCRHCEKNYDVLDIEMLHSGKSIPELITEYNLQKETKPTSKSEQKNKPKSAYSWQMSEREHPFVNKYFNSRNIIFSEDFPQPFSIRYSEFKDKKTGEIKRSIVFAVVNIANYTHIDTMARTWLDEDACKINRTYGKGQDFTGKGVWLSGKKSLSESKLLIGEGVETVLSAMAATGLTGVSGLDSGKMQNVEIPENVTELYVLADEDELKKGAKKGFAGQIAAIKTAEKFESNRDGNIAWIVSPSDSCFTGSPQKKDFNDLENDEIKKRFELKKRIADIDWNPPEQAIGNKSTANSDLEIELSKMNELHAAVLLGGKFRILKEGYDGLAKRKKIDFMTLDTFKNFNSNKHVFVEDKSGNLRRKQLTDEWMAWTDRRTYDDVVFAPDIKNCPECSFNLFTGFPASPKEGDWSLMANHIFNVICDGDKENYLYLLCWMARIVQKPGGRKPGVAVVLKGGKGVGKGIFVNYFGKIFGEAFLPIADSQNFTGRFNMHLSKTILCFLDEAVWGGDKQTEGKLKALITEDTILFEPKGIDSMAMQNHLNIIIASNEDWVIPATGDERRFFVLSCIDQFAGDTEYFRAIRDERDNGGVEAMMHDLLHFDCKQVELRLAPKTDALREQVSVSLTVIQKFWHEVIDRGFILSDHYSGGAPVECLEVPNGDIPFEKQMEKQIEEDKFWPREVFKYQVHNEFVFFCKNTGLKQYENSVWFWRRSSFLFPKSNGRSKRRILAGKQISVFCELPTRDEAKKRFVDAVGVSFEE